MCSLFMFPVCVCFLYVLCVYVCCEEFRPPAVDKRLCASGGSELVVFSYIIAAFSSSETNIIESRYHNNG